MARMKAEILTPWQLIETEPGSFDRVPQVAADYGLATFQDITGQALLPPSPNIFSLLIECDDVTLSQIANDPTYVVVWEDFA